MERTTPENPPYPADSLLTTSGAELSLAGRRVLVTGAGGFIGSHLVERLVADGADVRAFLHYSSRNDLGALNYLPGNVTQDVEVFWGDLRDSHTVRKAMAGVSGVFHLGALIGIPYSYHSPDAYVATNVVGTLNVLEAGLAESVDFIVHTSTSEVYGTAQNVPIDESHPLSAQSPYAATKIGADQLAQSFHLSFDLPVSILRPFNTFGPRQSTRAVIPTIVTQALEGDDIRLGSLTTVRDMTFVADTVEAFVQMAGRPWTRGEVINAGTGVAVSVGRLAEMVLDHIGREANVVSDEQRVRPDKSEVQRLICDNSKARELLGWQPSYTLEEGLSRVIEFFQVHSGTHVGEVYAI